MSIELEIQKVYIAYFNRPADSAGMTYWAGAISSGQATIQDVTSAFAASQEYQALYRGLSNETIIEKVYQNLFGRDPEAAGLAYWKGEMDAGAVSIGNVAYSAVMGAAGDDRATIQNKAAAAQSFSDYLARHQTDGPYTASGLRDAKEWLAAVDHRSSTLELAIDSLDERFAELVGPEAPPVTYYYRLVTTEAWLNGGGDAHDDHLSAPLPTFRFGEDKIRIVDMETRKPFQPKVVYHEADMSNYDPAEDEHPAIYAVHETKKVAYSSGFEIENDLKGGEALLVTFVLDGITNTYLHIDRDDNDAESAEALGYDEGEAIWEIGLDRTINLTGIVDLPALKNSGTVDGLFSYV